MRQREKLMRARHTPQLKAIESVLREAGRPLAIGEIHAAAAKHRAGLGIATIYRTVRELARTEKIASLNYPGQPTRYEWAVLENHAHFICHGCQRMFDMEPPGKIPLPKPRPRGFDFDGHEVIYYGFCPECRGP